MQRKSGKELKEELKKQAKENWWSYTNELRYFMLSGFLKRLAKFKFKNLISINEWPYRDLDYIESKKIKERDRDFDLFFNIMDSNSSIPYFCIKDIIENNSIDDGITFYISDFEDICKQNDYRIIRFWIKCNYDTLTTTLIFDCFTGLTVKINGTELEPGYFSSCIEYSLGDKLAEIILNGKNNEKVAYFYIIYYLMKIYDGRISTASVKWKFENKIKKSDMNNILTVDYSCLLNELEHSILMNRLWKEFQIKYKFAAKINWHEIMLSVKSLYSYCLSGY